MTKVKLITEQFDQVQLLESENSKDLYVQGIFSSAELKNKNGRIYKKDTLVREIQKLEEDIKRKSLFGELNHPQSPDINLEKVAIVIEKLEWKGNDVIGRAAVLDTPAGQIAKAIMKKGNIGISSRGLGTVNEDGYVNNSSYKLITWDLVGNPSNIPSWVNGIYEGKEWIIAEDGHLQETNKLSENEKKEAQKEAHEELLTKMTPEIIDLVAEDQKLTLDEAKEKYKKYVQDMIESIVNKI